MGSPSVKICAYAITVLSNAQKKKEESFYRGRIQKVVGISGIDDDAFAIVSQTGFVQLYFTKGAGYAAITLQNSRDANRLENTKALARKIAACL
jgi:hypothetical protein